MCTLLQHSRKWSAILALSAATMVAPTALAATVIDYADFSSTAGLQLNGTATPVAGALRLTGADYYQAGSAFSLNTVSLFENASFSTRFQFRFTEAGGACDGSAFGYGCGADGLVFVVQSVANNVGGAGGGIGYAGVSNSIGIEFDTWDNGGIDGFSSNHVGINANGDMNSLARAEVIEADMNRGGLWNAWVDYNGSNHRLEVRLSQSAARPEDALLSLTRDIFADLGTTDAYVGFTSGTGAAYANHEVLSWTLNDDFKPIGGFSAVPEPASLALAGGALLLAGRTRRRARR